MEERAGRNKTERLRTEEGSEGRRSERGIERAGLRKWDKRFRKRNKRINISIEEEERGPLAPVKTVPSDMV